MQGKSDEEVVPDAKRGYIDKDVRDQIFAKTGCSTSYRKARASQRWAEGQRLLLATGPTSGLIEAVALAKAHLKGETLNLQDATDAQVAERAARAADRRGKHSGHVHFRHATAEATPQPQDSHC